jgi:hypothetical protein
MIVKKTKELGNIIMKPAKLKSSALLDRPRYATSCAVERNIDISVKLVEKARLVFDILVKLLSEEPLTG